MPASMDLPQDVCKCVACQQIAGDVDKDTDGPDGF